MEATGQGAAEEYLRPSHDVELEGGQCCKDGRQKVWFILAVHRGGRTVGGVDVSSIILFIKQQHSATTTLLHGADVDT